MDTGTGLTILGSAVGGAKVVEKILGPTADYVGSGLKNWAEIRVKNVGRIFEKAAEKLGEKIEEPGNVSPRVLKEILDEGSFCDDELAAEYFGGVLASSRSGISRDDRAASYLKLTSDLSTYQIRFHFVSYAALRVLFTGSGLRPTYGEDLEKMWIFLPWSFLSVAMDFSEDESFADILLHCISGLKRNDLFEVGHWGDIGHVNSLNKPRGWSEVNEGGICIRPTQFGFDYWLWAVGLGATKNCTNYFDVDLAIPVLPDVLVPSTAIKLVQSK